MHGVEAMESSSCLPAAQAVQPTSPIAVNIPDVQELQLVAPVFIPEYVPPGQSAHTTDGSELNLPGAHVVQEGLPAVVAVDPAAHVSHSVDGLLSVSAWPAVHTMQSAAPPGAYTPASEPVGDVHLWHSADVLPSSNLPAWHGKHGPAGSEP